MSSVPKSRRQPHNFETPKKLKAIRKRVTELAVNDFGYDKERLEIKIQKFADSVTNFERKDAIVASMRAKNESYYADFVEDETKVTRNMARKIICEFEMGNSIFPSGDARVSEYRERRRHLNEAIGWLFSLKQELQYIAETLPCDANRYESLIDEIESAIPMVKGVRRAANKFLKKG